MLYQREFQNNEEPAKHHISCFGYETEADRQYPTHCHAYCEISYLVSGERYQIINGLVLCQDLVQVKMSFSHSNLPAIPKLPVDTIFQNHWVTYNRNDYEFVWYYKTFPSIQIPGGMHVCNC